ncbi:MAG: Do family serine endopeptidase [Alphaproteobacteria bacterium]
MKTIKYIFAIMLFTISSASAYEIRSFAPLVKKTIPAVVSIQVKSTQPVNRQMFNHGELPREMENFLEEFFNRNQQLPHPFSSQGSGFIFDKKGYVLTNHHVIYRADKVKVVLQDGTEYDADIKGTDPLTDLAVLKLKNVKKKLPVLSFGDSDKSEVGDWVIAIGNPLGLGGSVTKGIISARGRNIQSGLYDDYIQTDAPINRGNSGGPLINMQAKVIGINTIIISPTGGSIGLGFSIPSNLAKNISKQLIEKGSVSRAWLGISFRPVTANIADSLGLKKVGGVIITGLQTDSPADKGGLKVGDVILSANGKKITNKIRLPMIIAHAPIGKRIKLNVIRNGKAKELKILLVKRDEKTASINEPSGYNFERKQELPKTGIIVATLNNSLRKRYSIAKNINGLVVLDVKKTSSVYGMLKKGMVISQINSFTVKNVKDGIEIVNSAIKQKKQNILLVIDTGVNSKNILTVELN